MSQVMRKLNQGLNDKRLEKKDPQHDYHRRKIDPAHRRPREPAPHQRENRLGHLIKKPDNRVIWIRINPRQQCPDNHNPEIETQ